MEPVERLKMKLAAIDEAVTMNELKKAVEAMLQFSVKLQTKTESELTTIKDAVDTAILRIKSEATDDTEAIKTEVTTQIDEQMSKMMLEHEAMMAEADAKLDAVHDGQNGQDADEKKIVADVLAQIPPIVIPEPKEETPGSVRDMLETLEGDERLNITAIKGVDELKIEIGKGLDNTRGSARGVFLKVNGSKKGFINEFNIVGSGVAYTMVNGLPTITITGGGSGTTAVETPTGTVNGANTAFTVVNTPLYIIVDGVSKFAILHYTYLAGAITITDGAPPTQYIRSVYSA